MIATVKANSAKQARELLESLGWVSGQPRREGGGSGWGVYTATVRGKGELTGKLAHGQWWNSAKACWVNIRSQMLRVEEDCANPCHK